MKKIEIITIKLCSDCVLLLLTSTTSFNRTDLILHKQTTVLKRSTHNKFHDILLSATCQHRSSTQWPRCISADSSVGRSRAPPRHSRHRCCLVPVSPAPVRSPHPRHQAEGSRELRCLCGMRTRDREKVRDAIHTDLHSHAHIHSTHTLNTIELQ